MHALDERVLLLNQLESRSLEHLCPAASHRAIWEIKATCPGVGAPCHLILPSTSHPAWALRKDGMEPCGQKELNYNHHFLLLSDHRVQL